MPSGRGTSPVYDEEDATLIAPFKTLGGRSQGSERPPAYQPASGSSRTAFQGEPPAYSPSQAYSPSPIYSPSPAYSPPPGYNPPPVPRGAPPLATNSAAGVEPYAPRMQPPEVNSARPAAHAPPVEPYPVAHASPAEQHPVAPSSAAWMPAGQPAAPIPAPEPAAPAAVEAGSPVFQAPLPGVEAVSRFPSSITIRVPKVRREHLIAIVSVAATLALVGVVSFATRPAESRARGEFLGADRAEATAVAEKKAPVAAATASVATAATAPASVAAVATATAPTTTAAPVATAPAPSPTSAPAPTTLNIASLPTANHGHQPAPGGPAPVPAPVAPPPSKPEPPAPSAGGTGTISIVCSPACDSVLVKGRDLGPSPIIGVAMPEGSYPVLLKRSGAPNKASVITVTAGKNAALRIKM